MKIYINLDNLELIRAANDNRQVTSLSSKRGDALPIVIRFVKDGSPVRLDGSTVINFAIKEMGKYDTVPLVLNSSFTPSMVGTPDDDPHYTSEINLNTVELNSLFTMDGDPVDDPTFIDLMAEVTWQADGDTGPTSSSTFILKCNNDVFRGDESTPTAQPTPEDWLDTQNQNRGIQPIRSVTNFNELYPVDLVISNPIFDSNGDPIPTVAMGAMSRNPFVYIAVLSDSGTLQLTEVGNEFVLQYDGPGQALPLTWRGSNAGGWPSGITLMPDQNGQENQTITASPEMVAPRLGDQAWNSGNSTLYFWLMSDWQPVFVVPAP